ncbi:MAG: ATP-binding cassette domain-containing protein [Spirochaetia bacterium]|nr:ATP-binding cassette domain-containing protein [Spirochaetia bacterium]
MIEVTGLSKSFGDFAAVRDLNFTIQKNSGITALLGPNGAGKTTTLRLLTGYLQPTSGSVKVADMDLADEDNLIKVKRRIGYLPESSPQYPEMLVSEYLEFVGRVHGLSGDALEAAGREMVDKLELGSHLYSPLGILSKGFRQRAALAAALIHKPDVIILDEPTSGLDPNQILQIRRLIRDLGQTATLILSTHILQEVEDICERVIIIARGRVVADESMARLRSGSGIFLSAKGEGIAGRLKGLQGITSVAEEKSADGFHRYSCATAPGVSPESLFQQVAASGWQIREFRPSARSLEETFRELTI